MDYGKYLHFVVGMVKRSSEENRTRVVGWGELTMKLIKLKLQGLSFVQNFFQDFGRKVFTCPYVSVGFQKIRYFKVAVSFHS